MRPPIDVKLCKRVKCKHLAPIGPPRGYVCQLALYEPLEMHTPEHDNVPAECPYIAEQVVGAEQ